MSRYVTHIKRLTRHRASLELFYERIAPLVRSPKLGPVLWQLPPTFRRDDERLARRSRAAAGPRTLRVPPRELVRGRGVRAAARARRRARDRRHARAAVPDARADGGLDVRPLPLRPPRRAAATTRRASCAEWARADRRLARRGDVYAYFNNDWRATRRGTRGCSGGCSASHLFQLDDDHADRRRADVLERVRRPSGGDQKARPAPIPSDSRVSSST